MHDITYVHGIPGIFGAVAGKTSLNFSLLILLSFFVAPN